MARALPTSCSPSQDAAVSGARAIAANHESAREVSSESSHRSPRREANRRAPKAEPTAAIRDRRLVRERADFNPRRLIDRVAGKREHHAHVRRYGEQGDPRRATASSGVWGRSSHHGESICKPGFVTCNEVVAETGVLLTFGRLVVSVIRVPAEAGAVCSRSDSLPSACRCRSTRRTLGTVMSVSHRSGTCG